MDESESESDNFEQKSLLRNTLGVYKINVVTRHITVPTKIPLSEEQRKYMKSF